MALDPLLDIKDLEKQKFVEDAGGNVAVRVDATFDVEYASTISSTNVILASTGTEYSHTFPTKTKQARVRARQTKDVRYAWVTGKVAGPVMPYSTLPAGMELSIDAVSFTGQVLYLSTSSAGTIVEVEMAT